MKTHTRRCKDGEQPCTQEHSYYCADCGNEFETSQESFYRQDKRHRVLPSMFWPVCSLRCYRSYFAEASDSNPNGLTWFDLHIPVRGEDEDRVIDFQDQDDLDILSSHDMEEMLDSNPIDNLDQLVAELEEEA